MNLVTLYQSPRLHAHYDTWNNWLFLDWHGTLTLPDVQQDCLELLRCCCAYPCQRVLNNNVHVQAIAANIAPWARQEFVPFLRLVGVEQVAWVWAPLPMGPLLVGAALGQPLEIEAAAFGELEAAVEWLQNSPFDQVGGGTLALGYPAEGRIRREAGAETLIARVSAALA